MPYIDYDLRDELYQRRPETVGELTYVLYANAVQYGTDDLLDISFARHAEVVAALECAKHEYIRRHLSQYEDRKIQENGDVFAPGS